MNERTSDFAMLSEFVREGRQTAFSALTRRHLDLVYATALRVLDDSGGAEEVAQNVFTALARKAWQFAPDDSLPAWLYKTALLESKHWLRGELRRRRREQAAAELGTTMNIAEDQAAFRALLPLLDDALLSLREKDRTALLLRYYEKQSLREVGAAFGVSEDTAHKRVQSALEKVTEFFKRRGFKTATVAATAAALQQTAVSTSASLAAAIVGVALKNAPTITGLGLWLARLAALSKVQTAALCVLLAVGPAAWKLNEGHTAGRELKEVEKQLATGRGEAASRQAELERMRAEIARLEQSVAQANQAEARASADAQAFIDWKQKVRSALLAADYRWDDNAPFARIPKAVLPELIREGTAGLFAPPGVVNPFARELMGMSAEERQATESALQRFFSVVGTKLAARMAETNAPLTGKAVARRWFTLSIDGGSVTPERTKILEDFDSLLGEERSRLAKSKPPVVASSDQVSLDGSVTPDGKGGFKVFFMVNYGLPQEWPMANPPKTFGVLTNVFSVNNGNGYTLNLSGFINAELSSFLPEGDPNRTPGIERFIKDSLPAMSEPARQRVIAWLQEEAIARLGGKENQ